ncbi:MAG TPA: SpoIIE family protein phosphatase [Bryobacteraceae bacterium]|jgi:sigma-B regulation protein RsbU (phosphoserine phosphatase)|nr:SpoIIE family protein phosphatase [Bryobacteraceae bacterium]
MSRLRKLAQQLGKSGIAFLAAILVSAIAYALGWDVLVAFGSLAVLVLGIWQAVRIVQFIVKHSLWSLRNRLLFVYALIGILPIVLILVLVGLSAWALMSELAIYLANSELDRRIASVERSAIAFEDVPPEARIYASQKIIDSEKDQGLPGLTLEIKDQAGTHDYPANASPLGVPPSWGNVHGLVYRRGEFYAWAHVKQNGDEITALAPLYKRIVANLVPNLGEISIFESKSKSAAKDSPAPAEIRADDDLTSSISFSPQEVPAGSGQVPPPVNRFDVLVLSVTSRPHYDWSHPNEIHDGGFLTVVSRPSAILHGFFSGAETYRGTIYVAVIAIAVLFLLVELVALVIGVSLSARITSAVNQLYEGTRRVIKGDFEQLITVRSRDQLGDLAVSFNQMTGTIERLVAVEKEKERLQTEVAIAREVQNNLYPKLAPPNSGLKLTVRCEPARMVSGDYYDYQGLFEDNLTFALGDVAGKGISAALLMASLQAALRAQISNCEGSSGQIKIDAATIVSQLNRQLFAHTAPEKYATFFFALYNECTHTLTYTNAGHLSPLLLRGDTVVPLDTNGMVVGAFPWAKYDESNIIMQPNDLLVCYTDGITEPENAYGEEFGVERLIELVQRNAHRADSDILGAVMDAVRNWTGVSELFDDMTLLLARRVEAQ